jgi:hypothetical protein
MTVNGTTATSETVSASGEFWSQTATIYVWLYNGSTYSTSSAKIDYSYNYWNGASTSISSGATLSVEGDTKTVSTYTITLSSVASNKTYYWSATNGTNGKQITPSNKTLTIETTASPIYIWCSAAMNGATTRSESSSVTKDGVITNSSVVDDVTGSKTTNVYSQGSAISTIPNSKDGTGLASENDYCAAHYYEADDYSDHGKWRVPNQRELIILAMNSNLSPTDGKDATNFYLSRTKGSVDAIYAARGMYLYQNTALRLQDDVNAGVIRCVRDATADEVAAKMPEDKEYDGEFEDNGDAI